MERLSIDATGTFLNTLSNQHVLYLNPLGNKSYAITAGFDEAYHKKFYHIRDMLLKVYSFNKKHGFKKVASSAPPDHIYQELALNN
jgi:hypothetical protein